MANFSVPSDFSTNQGVQQGPPEMRLSFILESCPSMNPEFGPECGKRRRLDFSGRYSPSSSTADLSETSADYDHLKWLSPSPLHSHPDSGLPQWRAVNRPECGKRRRLDVSGRYSPSSSTADLSETSADYDHLKWLSPSPLHSRNSSRSPSIYKQRTYTEASSDNDTEMAEFSLKTEGSGVGGLDEGALLQTGRASVEVIRDIAVASEVCYGMVITKIEMDETKITRLDHENRNKCLPILQLDVTENIGGKNLEFGVPGSTAKLKCQDSTLSIVVAYLLRSGKARAQALIALSEIHNLKSRKSWRCSVVDVYLNLYGLEEEGDRAGRFLLQNKVYLQDPKFPEAGLLYKNPHLYSLPDAPVSFTQSTEDGGIPKSMLQNQPVDENFYPVADEFNMLLESLWDSNSLQELEGHPRIKTPLLLHQKKGLGFLVSREGVRPSPWHGYKPDWSQSTTRGGILADHMGLGKSLTMLALVLASLEQARVHRSQSCSPDRIPSRATLIVTPVSTLASWEHQTKIHIKKDKPLEHYRFHGRQKVTDRRKLQDFDIVFTSYQTLAQDYRDKGPLSRLDWFRVVLDGYSHFSDKSKQKPNLAELTNEIAHIIRNHRSLVSRAACTLMANRRWCVTGTPLQNSLSDIETLLRFLRHESYSEFDRDVVCMLKQNNSNGLENLRRALGPICLRRTKETIDLPPRRELTQHLDFTPAERAIYEAYKLRLLERCVQGNHKKSRTLEMITKLRLICNFGTEFAVKEGANSVSDSPEALCCECGTELFDWQATDENYGVCAHRAICSDCHGLIADSEVDRSTTSYCEICLSTASNTETEAVIESSGPSTKIKALESYISQGPGLCKSKHVVFSTWTKMLDLVEKYFAKAGISLCRVDGSMSEKSRAKALSEFRNSPSKVVLLISLGAGAVGIDLTCASTVHILEPHWNPMLEQQALERVHRIGQTKEVTMIRYIIRDSFEESVLSLQRRKLELARLSLSESGTSDKGSHGGLQELEALIVGSRIR